MGYRTYLGIIDKEKLNDLLACNTVEELENIYKKYNWECNKDDYDGRTHWYFPVYKLDYRAEFGFGKYADLGSEFDNNKKDIFPKGHPLHDQFEESDFSYGGEELFLSAIENYRCKIRDYFNDLLKDAPDKDSWAYFDYKRMSDENKAKWKYTRLLNAIKDKAYEWSDGVCNKWGVYPYNLKKDNDTIINSWLYEYEIFELVRLYKTFDPEKEMLIYFGW